MAAKKGKGLYLVWVDVPADKEDEINRWYNEEHLYDVLARPGVLNAARYVALSGSPKYLACYEMQGPEVLESQEYRDHRTAPTEWSKRLNLQGIATRFINNNYKQIFPLKVSQEVSQSDMAPVLQIGRMSIPPEQEDEFNTFYNTVYAANYAKVPGCISARRYTIDTGPGPKYSVVYELEHEGVPQSPEWMAARKKSGGILWDIFPQMKHDEGSAGVYKKIIPL